MKKLTRDPYDCFSTNEGDSWYDRPDDAQIIEDIFGSDLPKVGDRYEVLSGWRSEQVEYVVTEVSEDGDVTAEEIIDKSKYTSVEEFLESQIAENNKLRAALTAIVDMKSEAGKYGHQWGSLLERVHMIATKALKGE